MEKSEPIYKQNYYRMTDWEKQNYISLARAAQGTPYSQEYLSLLVRKGKIDAKKFGRNWYVTKTSVHDYLRRQQDAALRKANFAKDSEMRHQDNQDSKDSKKEAVENDPISNSVSDSRLSPYGHGEYQTRETGRQVVAAFVRLVRHAGAVVASHRCSGHLFVREIDFSQCLSGLQTAAHRQPGG